MLAQAMLLVSTARQVARSQQTQGQIAVVGGAATDVLGIASSAVTVAPSLTVTPDPRLSFAIGGSGTRFTDQQWSLGGAATLAARAPLAGHAALTFNGNAGATGTSYNVSYLTADLLPALEASFGAVTVYGGTHLAHAATSGLTQPPPAPGPLPTPQPATSSSSVTHDAIGVLGGATAQYVASDGESMALGYREEHSTVATIRTVDRSASLSLAQGTVTLGGTLGVRREPSQSTAFGSANLSIALNTAFALQFAGGSYAANRLVGTPGGRFVNAGIALRFGGSAASPPEPEGIRPPASGMTRLAIRAPDAERVEVAGDFTNWQRISAKRATNGVWFVDLRVPPGRYRYAFRVNGTEWRVPDGTTVVDDDFGGKAAWLTITGSSR